MKTAYHPLSTIRGATFDRTYTLTMDGDPVDLDGYTVTMDVRTTPDETGTLVARLTSDTNEADPGVPVGSITIDGTAGTLAVLIEATETAKLPVGAYFYDVRIGDPLGPVDFLLYGPFAVARRVTTS